MFTGLVEEVGRIRSVQGSGRYRRIEISAETVLEGTVAGDSISVDGACQTVTAVGNDWFCIESLAATLQKTTLGGYRPGRRVNLERALLPSTRLGGHFVQGHIDSRGTVMNIERERENVFLYLKIDPELMHLCVRHGSVSIDGVSLTVADLVDDVITINIIPLTWNRTALSARKPGDSVNIEADILGRYVSRILGLSVESWNGKVFAGRGLSAESLQSMGY